MARVLEPRDDLAALMEAIGERARAASRTLATAPRAQKDAALEAGCEGGGIVGGEVAPRSAASVTSVPVVGRMLWYRSQILHHRQFEMDPLCQQIGAPAGNACGARSDRRHCNTVTCSLLRSEA